MPNPTSTLNNLPPYLFAELDKKIAAARAKGVDIISLGVGDPDLPTPQPIVDEMAQAIARPKNHQYPAYDGSPEFRKACTEWMKTRFGVDVCPDTETLALIGAKEGIAHIILAYVQPGDVVLCPSPGYPVYNNYTVICDGKPVVMPLKAERDFWPDFSAISAEDAKAAKIMFLNYPNNPTGAIVSDAQMDEAIAFCREHDIVLCHDNAYSEMTFDGYEAPSFLSRPGAKDVCIEMFSFSKMFNMTGWRLGFAVGNPKAIKALGSIKNTTDSGAFNAIQEAGILGLAQYKALTKDLNEIYGRRRTLFVEGLKKLGWPIEAGPATFYLWAPVPSGMSSATFATLLLEECGIVVPPGNGYGPEGEGFFRVALTQNEDRLREALKRMEDNGVRFDMALNESAATV